MLGSGSWFFREASPENIPNLSKMNQNNIELCKTTGFWWVDRPYITSKESELPMIFRSDWGNLALQELWVQQHREYRVWRKKYKKKKKRKKQSNQKKQTRKPKPRKKTRKTKKNCGKCRFCLFLIFFVCFWFLWFFFLFFLFLLVILPVDLFFWWFCFF